jgi:hypothetical protein
MTNPITINVRLSVLATSVLISSASQYNDVKISVKAQQNTQNRRIELTQEFNNGGSIMAIYDGNSPYVYKFNEYKGW